MLMCNECPLDHVTEADCHDCGSAAYHKPDKPHPSSLIRLLSCAAKSIADLEDMKKTHVEWAAYFESNPDIEKKYVASGEWDTAAKHREIVDKYDNAIRILSSIAS